MAKYKFYKDDNKIIAVSSYAGRPVKGYAKCSPADEFDEAAGRKLAEARCNQKVARKRRNRAFRKLDEARKNLEIAKRQYNKMINYVDDAILALENANDMVMHLETHM